MIVCDHGGYPEYVVDCSQYQSCKSAVIMGPPDTKLTVNCGGYESCAGALIQAEGSEVNVICSNTRSCAKAEIRGVTDKTAVTCSAVQSCEGTSIFSSKSPKISCLGRGACRQAKIFGDNETAPLDSLVLQCAASEACQDTKVTEIAGTSKVTCKTSFACKNLDLSAFTNATEVLLDISCGTGDAQCGNTGVAGGDACVECTDCTYQAIASGGEPTMAHPGAPQRCSELEGDWVHVRHMKRKPWTFGVPVAGY
jgi:hypothetical protein